MTLRSLDPDDRIAYLASLRDRQHAFDLEDAVRDLDDVIGNLRRDRTAPSGAPAASQ